MDTKEAPEAAGKGLKTGALGLVAVIVIGVASTAPGYSLAASLGLVTGEVGAQAPAIMWLAFLPMAFIAAAYFYLNRADPDCGTTFTWVTRSMGPRSGWMGGWGIIMADLVIMPSLAQIASSYTFLLFGLDDLAANTWATMVLGLVFIMAMTWICVRGIELSARSQVLLLGTELAVLVLFAIVAIVKVYNGGIEGSVRPSLSWLNPLEIDSFSAVSAGLLIAVFIYWGWDTAVTVNEETADSNRTPGLAAIFSTFILIAIYVVVSFCAQAVQGPEFLTENSDDVISATGDIVFGSGFFQKLLILAVLTSAAASCQTTILPAARSSLSMAVHRAAPKWLGEVHPRFLTPANSTWLFGIIACVWYVLLVVISEIADGDVLGWSIAGVGLMISYYFGITGFACVFYYRRYLFKSLKNFVFVGLLPFLGAAMLTYVFIQSLWDMTSGDYVDPPQQWLGVSPVFVIGVGLLVLGFPLMYYWKSRDGAFFQVRRDPHEMRPSPDGGDPLPPLVDERTEPNGR